MKNYSPRIQDKRKPKVSLEFRATFPIVEFSDSGISNWEAEWNFDIFIRLQEGDFSPEPTGDE